MLILVFNSLRVFIRIKWDNPMQSAYKIAWQILSAQSFLAGFIYLFLNEKQCVLNLFIYLFIGCIGSLLLCASSL